MYERLDVIDLTVSGMRERDLINDYAHKTLCDMVSNAMSGLLDIHDRIEADRTKSKPSY